jgi:hypothetical protein
MDYVQGSFRVSITLGNKILLFFLAHGGKNLFPIELLTLNSNMSVGFLQHPLVFVTAKLNVQYWSIYQAPHSTTQKNA